MIVKKWLPLVISFFFVVCTRVVYLQGMNCRAALRRLKDILLLFCYIYTNPRRKHTISSLYCYITLLLTLIYPFSFLPPPCAALRRSSCRYSTCPGSKFQINIRKLWRCDLIIEFYYFSFHLIPRPSFGKLSSRLLVYLVEFLIKKCILIVTDQ